jgi:hypothetical protein
MNNNITYFIGAGASCGTKEKPAVPILKNFSEELKKFRNELVKARFADLNPNNSHLFSSWDELFETGTVTSGFHHYELDKDLKKFLGETNKIFKDLVHHSTVDTLAKRYYIINEKESSNSDLIQLKSFLVLFFLDMHFNKNRQDMRYDNFISTLIDYNVDSKSYLLPTNLKVVSWNYDTQFEQALVRYTNQSIIDTQGNFNIFPSLKYKKKADLIYDFEMIKLNGTAGLFCKNDGTNQLTDIEEILSGKKSNLELLELYTDLSSNKRLSCIPFYRYSFEEESNKGYANIENHKIKCVESAKEIFSKTKDLVIIGYSFPPFNRKVDAELLNSLPYESNIYIQDIYPEMVQTIKDCFPSLKRNKIEIHFVENLSQFHIPSTYFESNNGYIPTFE